MLVCSFDFVVRTLAPSALSSSNSWPGLNFISVVLKVEEVTSTKLSPSFFSSTVGVTALAALRVIRPTPGNGHQLWLALLVNDF